MKTLQTLEQYESSCRMLKLLHKLGISEDALEEWNFWVIEEQGPDWEICDGCAEVVVECSCEENNEYDIYDDEASYED